MLVVCSISSLYKQLFASVNFVYYAAVECLCLSHPLSCTHVTLTTDDFQFLPRISMHSMHSAILFYRFCPSVRPSRCDDTVSKGRHMSLNFSHHLVGALFCFWAHRRYRIPREPLSGDVKYTRVEKDCYLLPKSPFFWETVRDRSMVTDRENRSLFGEVMGKSRISCFWFTG